MTQKAIEAQPPVAEAALEPACGVPMCECDTPAAIVAELEAASSPALDKPPTSAPHEVSARLWLRLPLWARLVAGVGLWAVVYHYWLPVATWLTQELLALTEGRLASSIEFFIYDTVKVLLLLTIVVFGVGMVRSFFSPQRARCSAVAVRRPATCWPRVSVS